MPVSLFGVTRCGSRDSSFLLSDAQIRNRAKTHRVVDHHSENSIGKKASNGLIIAQAGVLWTAASQITAAFAGGISAYPKRVEGAVAQSEAQFDRFSG